MHKGTNKGLQNKESLQTGDLEKLVGSLDEEKLIKNGKILKFKILNEEIFNIIGLYVCFLQFFELFMR